MPHERKPLLTELKILSYGMQGLALNFYCKIYFLKIICSQTATFDLSYTDITKSGKIRVFSLLKKEISLTTIETTFLRKADLYLNFPSQKIILKMLRSQT